MNEIGFLVPLEEPTGRCGRVRQIVEWMVDRREMCGGVYRTAKIRGEVVENIFSSFRSGSELPGRWKENPDPYPQSLFCI